MSKVKLTKPQREFLREVALGNARSCSDRYKPGRRLVDLGLLTITHNSHGTWWLSATDAGKALVTP